MKKISHKFSYEALEVIQHLACRVLELQRSESDYEKLLFCALVRINLRLSKLLIFRFHQKTVTFSMEDFVALRINYGRTDLIWGEYESAVINDFLSEGGKKL